MDAFAALTSGRIILKLKLSFNMMNPSISWKVDGTPKLSAKRKPRKKQTDAGNAAA